MGVIIDASQESRYSPMQTGQGMSVYPQRSPRHTPDDAYSLVQSLLMDAAGR